jgi:hypothetical protein
VSFPSLTSWRESLAQGLASNEPVLLPVAAGVVGALSSVPQPATTSASARTSRARGVRRRRTRVSEATTFARAASLAKAPRARAPRAERNEPLRHEALRPERPGQGLPAAAAFSPDRYSGLASVLSRDPKNGNERRAGPRSAGLWLTRSTLLAKGRSRRARPACRGGTIRPLSGSRKSRATDTRRNTHGSLHLRPVFWLSRGEDGARRKPRTRAPAP